MTMTTSNSSFPTSLPYIAGTASLLLYLHQRRSNPLDQREAEDIEKIAQFVENNPDYLYRSNLKGHVCSSALVLNEAHTHVLLTHHKKLNHWLQFGGHADGDFNLLQVALKETEEESGLSLNQIRILSLLPIFVGAFRAPLHKEVPEHVHYDFVYLFQTEGQPTPTVSEESHDLAWVPLEEITHPPYVHSMVRLITATQEFLKNAR